MGRAAHVAALLLLCCCAAGAELVGCDGFVRLAPALEGHGVDLALVQVRLETAAGALVESTACAPNGYFFLPVYQHAASLRIVVDGPPAWHFREAWVAAEVADGACNGGLEAEFLAAGLAVEGRLEPPQGCGGDAAAGVEVELLPAAGGPPAARATADAGGAYRLGPVPPGRYALRPAAGAEGWRVALVEVEASPLAVEARGALAMAGLDVAGSVLALGAPLAHVALRLEQEGRAQALTSTDAAGRFRFAGVACGTFRVALAQEEEQRLRLEPRQQEGRLHSGAVRLPAFAVDACLAEGRVADVAGAAVAGAEVLADGRPVATTGADGTFRWLAPLAAMQLQARAPGLRWPAVQAEAAPCAPLPLLQAREARVEGRVEDGSGREVLLRPAGLDAPPSAAQATTRATADASGAFELWAAAGAWEAWVHEAPADAALGLRWEPLPMPLLLQAPLSGLLFRRAALGLAGVVQCAGPCAAVRLTLASEADGVVHEALADAAGAFSFSGLQAGGHELRVHGPGRCWTPEARHVRVALDAALPAPAFLQHGWALALLLPRPMVLHALPQQEGREGQVEHVDQVDQVPHVDQVQQQMEQVLHAPAGPSSHCLRAGGLHLLEAEGLRFAAPLYFTAGAGEAAALAPEVAEVEVRTSVLLPAQAVHLAPHVALFLRAEGEGEEGGGAALAASAQEAAADGGLRLSFAAWLPAQGGGRLEARGEGLLFTPAALDAGALALAALEGRQAASFAGQPAQYVEGRVRPAMAGVEVRVLDGAGATLLATHTGEDGAYRAGPLAAGSAHAVEAHAAGFAFLREEGGFAARRLGGLRVEVMDEAGAPLSGVLLSLTGAASFRRNSETDAGGADEAADLAPGAYHLRPLLREYAFEPAAAAVDVQEGGQALLQLRARRVAYSAFGHVRALSGAGERLLTVTAEAEGRREEAQTDADGAFRLRGLLPGAAYRVLPAPCARVAAFLPAARTLPVAQADAHGLDFLALRAPARLDVSGAVHVEAAHLASLTVHLLDAGGAEVARAALAALPLFSFSGLAKGAYRVEVRSSLAPALFSCPPVAAAVPAAVGATWVDVAFPVQDRALAAAEQSSAASFLLLLLLSAAAAAALQRRQLLALAARLQGRHAPPAAASANDYIPAEQRRHAARKQKRSHK